MNRETNGRVFCPITQLTERAMDLYNSSAYYIHAVRFIWRLQLCLCFIIQLVLNFVGLVMVNRCLVEEANSSGHVDLGTSINMASRWTSAEACYWIGSGFGNSLVVAIDIYLDWNHLRSLDQQYLLSKSLYFIDRSYFEGNCFMALDIVASCPNQTSCCDYSCYSQRINWMIFIIHAFDFSLFFPALEAE